MTHAEKGSHSCVGSRISVEAAKHRPAGPNPTLVRELIASGFEIRLEGSALGRVLRPRPECQDACDYEAIFAGPYRGRT